MKISSDGFLPNCIFTWSSAAYEYQQIDSKKGCDWDNSVHATFFVLKLIPFVGNAAFLGQKLWRLGSACCGNTKEKIENTSQNTLPNPNNGENTTNTVTEIEPTTTEIEPTVTEIKPSDALNTQQKEALKLLQSHPAVIISDIDILNKETLLAEIKTNYHWENRSVFLGVSRSNLEDWEKGITPSLFNTFPRLCFIEICDDRLVYHPFAITIDENGHFYSKGEDGIGTHASIEELADAHAKYIEKPEYELKAPILKTTLQNEMDRVAIPHEIIDHPCFAGKFLNRVDFLEKGVRKMGDFYYSAADRGYWVKTVVAQLFFTYENSKPQGEFYNDETSLDDWFKKIKERFGE